MTPKRQRLIILTAILLCFGAATALVLTAFGDHLVYFYSPGDLKEKQVEPGQRIRIGGLVVNGSIVTGKSDENAPTVFFTVTDTEEELNVFYKGLVPALFRDGQGVVAEGRLNEKGVFEADTLLAKHDENYMPPEVAKALKERGEWREDQPQ